MLAFVVGARERLHRALLPYGPLLVFFAAAWVVAHKRPRVRLRFFMGLLALARLVWGPLRLARCVIT